MTGIQRYFLGWEYPFLSTSAKWLQEKYLDEGLGSGNRLLVLVSGQAVVRQLQSFFLNEANKNGRAVEMPTIQTTSQFFKTVLPKHLQIADQQQVLIATAAYLRGMDSRKLKPIIGARPIVETDFTAWCQVAKRVLETNRIAAGGGLTLQRETWPQEAQLLLTEDAQKRFDLLHQIQLDVQSKLAEHNLTQFEQVQVQLLHPDSELHIGLMEHIVVVGGSDLSKATTQLLQRLLGDGVTVDSLIRSPEIHQDGFDLCGCIHSEYWLQMNIDLHDEDIIVAGSPSAQSVEAVRALSSLQGITTTDQIAVISTDEQLIPILRRHMEGHGVRSRFSGGIPVLQTSEALLLSAIAEFIATQSYSSYAALLRHPDIASVLRIEEHLYSRLSRYSTQVIPSKLSNTKWFQPKNTRENLDGLEELHQKVFELCMGNILLEQKGASITECSNEIRSLLLKIYGSKTLDRTSVQLKVLQKIFGVLDKFDGIPEPLSKQIGDIKCSEALQLVLRDLEQSTIPELPDIAAVDTVGWLEGMASDAPHLVVVGMSADIGGSNNSSDAFFPDSLLGALGLETIDRRMARDAHAIIAMQQSRTSKGSLKWIVGRKNTDGDPLSPNPLLMRLENIKELDHDSAIEVANKLAIRSSELVVSFDSEQPLVPPQFETERCGDGITVPRPSEYLTEPLRQLSVTAFKDYLACQYRFWLKHVLKLDVAEEGSSELDAKLFGSFVHKVLQRFGETDAVKNETDATVIEEFVCDALDAIVKEQLGSNLNNKIYIQVELAKYRLRTFAKHQAESAKEGWEIVCTERFLVKEMEVEEGTFKVRGVIDRVEVHKDGRIRVLDYKTGSTTANKAHFTKDQWIDLQLPLYRELLTEIQELKGFDMSKDNVQLGYFKIGDQDSTSGIDLLCPPSKMEDVLEDTINFTIGAILRNEYCDFPITPAPKYSDTYSWICQDNSVEEEAGGTYE